MEIFKRFKEIRNVLLVIAGGVLGNMIGTKIVSSIIEWSDKDISKKGD